ncbi:hypothetical protein QVN03_25090 [Raoultella terrigena]|uniref:hypothetical protein n=1 Tax=Enterobacterales TaxID=91347 RepID=UPI0025AF0F4A|nr:hypothetical protein [Raoultella terrigena]WJV38600.1 hypothetical protein QVN03_25090 [Raoultella terrigena]
MNILSAEVFHSVINGLNATNIHQEYALFFVSPGDPAFWSFLLAATLLTLQLMPLGSKRKHK